MKRTLELRRETLAELAGEELSGVVGAQGLTPVVFTLPVNHCMGTMVCLTCDPTCVNC